MNLEALVSRLRALGFVCDVEHFGAKGTRVIVAKLASTPGNQLADTETRYPVEDGGQTTVHMVTDPCPIVWERDGVFDLSVVAGIPSSPGAYGRTLTDAEEVYEELLHYFFDADSMMSLEPGFVRGQGRPEGA